MKSFLTRSAPLMAVLAIVLVVTTAQTQNVPGVNLKQLMAGHGKLILQPGPTRSHPIYLQYDYRHPITVRTIIINVNPKPPAQGTVLASDDGQSFRAIGPFETSNTAPATISLWDHPNHG